MSLAVVYSRASSGISAPLVTVEAHLSFGMAGFCIVGLPEAAVKESRDRVRSALMNTHFEFPDKRITINLAPADLPKEGGRFDLPIALGILAASGQIPIEVLAEYEFTGELALSGELRAVRGVLPMALGAAAANRKLIVPAQNADEASLVQSATILSANHILEVCSHLCGEQFLVRSEWNMPSDHSDIYPDLSEVKGQRHAKRALEIAAAGKHNLLLIGPPGTGKTMLANRLPSIMPLLSEDDALEVAAIASISHHGFQKEQWRQIPYRAPHHSSSSIALVGGGRPPRPGEISLSHRGILFLDELPEFSRHVLESLREPLESKCITISRAAFQTIFPAHFQFIAAMNPCPCGDNAIEFCRCSKEEIKRYMGKISGPLLDRIDMHVEVPRLSPLLLAISEETKEETSAEIRERVLKAQHIQLQRQKKYNNALTIPELNKVSHIELEAEKLLNQIMVKFNLSARVYHRIIKLARTLADLNARDVISEHEVSEALQFRCLDRFKTLN